MNSRKIVSSLLYHSLTFIILSTNILFGKHIFSILICEDFKNYLMAVFKAA